MQSPTGGEDWFGRAPDAFRREVLARSEWLSLEPGATLYDAVERGGDLYGIAEGWVEFYSRFSSDENPLVHLAREDFWFGVGSMVTEGPRRVTALARTRTRLARCSNRALRGLLDANPEWWRHIAAAAIEYGDIAAGAYAHSLVRDPRRRCCAVLLRVAGLYGARDVLPEALDVPLTQAELASLVGVSRATLAPVIARLRDDRLVEPGYRAIRIIDASGLAKAAASVRPTSKLQPGRG